MRPILGAIGSAIGEGCVVQSDRKRVIGLRPPGFAKFGRGLVNLVIQFADGTTVRDLHQHVVRQFVDLQRRQAIRTVGPAEDFSVGMRFGELVRDPNDETPNVIGRRPGCPAFKGCLVAAQVALAMIESVVRHDRDHGNVVVVEHQPREGHHLAKEAFGR